jgi:hypothetical protein
MKARRMIVFLPLLIIILAVYSTVYAQTGATVEGEKLSLTKGSEGFAKCLIYTPNAEAKNSSGKVEEFENRKLLVDLKPVQEGQPIFLILLTNPMDKDGRAMKGFAECRADKIVHELKGLSLGPQIWCTPGSILVFQGSVHFGSYYFTPTERAPLCFLLLKDKGALYLYGQGRVTRNDKLVTNFDQTESLPLTPERIEREKNTDIKKALEKVMVFLKSELFLQGK